MFFLEEHLYKGCSSVKNMCMKDVLPESVLPERGSLIHIDATTSSCARVCVHAHSGAAHTPSCVYKNILHTHEEWVSGWVGRKVSGWVGGWVCAGTNILRRENILPAQRHCTVWCVQIRQRMLFLRRVCIYIYIYIYIYVYAGWFPCAVPLLRVMCADTCDRTRVCVRKCAHMYVHVPWHMCTRVHTRDMTNTWYDMTK